MCCSSRCIASVERSRPAAWDDPFYVKSGKSPHEKTEGKRAVVSNHNFLSIRSIYRALFLLYYDGIESNRMELQRIQLRGHFVGESLERPVLGHFRQHDLPEGHLAIQAQDGFGR